MAGAAGSINFEPGKIVLAGATPKNGQAGTLFDSQVGGSPFSLNGSGPASSGNAFIFTSQLNPGLSNPPTRLSTSSAYQALRQGESGFKSGGTDKVTFDLDGLNQTGVGFPTELKPYNGVAVWQDRKNSKIRYNSDGTYGCGAPYLNCNKSTGEENNDYLVAGSPGMFIKAGANTRIRGVIYQPRGSWLTLQGSAGLAAPLQLISGAISLRGGATINLIPVTSGLPLSIVGLVE